VSVHVSLVRCLSPPPLRSISITRLRRYYGQLRLTTIDAPRPCCLGLFERCAFFGASRRISPVTAQSLCEARRDIRSRGILQPLPLCATSYCLRATLSADPLENISGLNVFRGRFTVPFAPRLFSCLRIKHPITGMPARLDTGPVASGYPGGTPTH
jgi:hypothetical protein